MSVSESPENVRLAKEIRQVAVDRNLPDGTAYRSLPAAACDALASRFARSGRRIEIAALRNGVLPERYVRNFKTVSPEEQIRLLQSHVCIAGLGGLGGMVTEILARIGIGRLTLIDGDRFEESNLNRQWLSDMERLGAPKAEAAADRVRQVNPSVETLARTVYIRDDNVNALVNGADVIVDCLDDIHTRFILEDGARHAECPMVSAAVAGVSGHITVVLPQDTGLASIFGPRGSTQPRGAEAVLGCLPHGVALVATLECVEVVRILTGSRSALSGKLLAIDPTDYRLDLFALE